MTPVPARTIEKLDDRLSHNGSNGASSLELFEDAMGFISFAAQALAQDDFTKCFEPKRLEHEFDLVSSVWSAIVFPLYAIGVLIRYAVLLPLRVCVALISSIIFLLLHPIAYYSGSHEFTRFLFLSLAKCWAFSISAIIRHHGKKPHLKEPHVFVANHTTFIDYVLLSSHEFPHATVAQYHEGLFYYVLHYILKPLGTMMFHRNDRKDRRSLTGKLRDHVRLNRGAPMLIFPEGTCVNNEHTVLFHKGAFELGAKICPVAIKYNKSLLDPYWNTRSQSFTQHALYIMTRWCLVADVWWLEPQSIRPNESAIEFAYRVKALISETAGLQNLSWDGYLKNYMAPAELVKLRDNAQEHYRTLLKKRMKASPELSDDSSGSVTDKSSTTESSDMDAKPRTRSYSEWSAKFPTGNDTGRLDRRGSVTVIGCPSFPSWMPDNAIVDIKNELLKSVLSMDQEHSTSGFMSHTSASITNLLKSVVDPGKDKVKDDAVVDTWKRFSKVKGNTSNVARRIENSTWREWFSGRIKKSGVSGSPSGDK